MLRSDECPAGAKNGGHPEPITVTAMTAASVARPSSTTIASARYATSRTPSHTSMIRRRSKRSTSTPAGSRHSTVTTSPMVPTRPARTGEPVRNRTSNGTARAEIAVPRSERDWLIQRRVKSRLRHRFAGASVMPRLSPWPCVAVKTHGVTLESGGDPCGTARRLSLLDGVQRRGVVLRQRCRTGAGDRLRPPWLRPAGAAAPARVDEQTVDRVRYRVQRRAHRGQVPEHLPPFIAPERDLQQHAPGVVVPLPVVGPVGDRGLG